MFEKSLIITAVPNTWKPFTARVPFHTASHLTVTQSLTGNDINKVVLLSPPIIPVSLKMRRYLRKVTQLMKSGPNSSLLLLPAFDMLSHLI